MKIFLSKKHYGALVDLLYLADWVLHAHDVDDRPETAHYRELMNLLLSHAKEMHAEALVESFRDQLMPSRVVEDRMQDVIEAYDEISMWTELIARLARRDAAREIGDEVLRDMSWEERLEVLSRHEEPWAEEFEEHGLSRLVVDNSRGSSRDEQLAEPDS